ncbi:tauD/TfdA-like domain-containing protein [Artemisia annua]|uniref:TauD/TfdA-like domain-containing protein n=1 Tax=Artemisia annua TaxID=35608 RepID=A0A2U1LQ38_ARTAN|nr:tauD/TfdA-like domain-containing protein [Artemisia annua]
MTLKFELLAISGALTKWRKYQDLRGLDFPSKIFFFCEEEPGKREETPVNMSHITYEKMKKKAPIFRCTATVEWIDIYNCSRR